MLDLKQSKPAMHNIKLTIIDDHEMVTQGLVALLHRNPGLSVVKTYTNGLIAIEEFPAIKPDVVLVDINMPIINGFDTANRILSMYPETKIIMISMEVKKLYMKKALETGIKGFVSKAADISELVQTIQSVYGGGLRFNNYLQVAE